jgi:L-ascorbate metabolism protein UlaG (beta-lactamase superfamily)
MSAVAALTYVGHATVLVELDGARLLCDPLLRGRLFHLRRVVPAPAVAALRPVDAALVSHLHADHLDPRSLRALDAPLVVVPAGGARWLRRRGVRGVHGMRVGERAAVGTVAVRAVPAAHARRRGLGPPSADPLGFVVEGAQRWYVAGDTDLFDEMRAIGPVDVAVLPIWGWGPRLGPGHLDPDRAALALRWLRPRVAIPIHWGTYVGLTVPRSRRASFLRDPPRRFAAAAARVAPDVEVRILAPGARTALGAPARAERR